MAEPDPCEFPTVVGIEEIPVTRARMAGGRRATTTFKHDLIAHELPVVLSDGAFVGREAGVGRVG
mgnify:CR=1 FL=1